MANTLAHNNEPGFDSTVDFLDRYGNADYLRIAKAMNAGKMAVFGLSPQEAAQLEDHDGVEVMTSRIISTDSESFAEMDTDQKPSTAVRKAAVPESLIGYSVHG